MLTAAFTYEFLSIHPYQDGNGRLSRLLTTLLLMKQGYGFVQYISFEHVIEARKDDYYRALMAGQKDRYQEEERIGEWVFYFLECMVTLVERLKTKYETYNKLERDLNDRQQRVLAFLKEKKKARIGEVDEAFPDYSRNTLKKDLAELVKEGLLIRTGERKGARYHDPGNGTSI
jgi:Fic family protein